MRLSDAQAQGTALLRAAGIAGASRDADRILAAVALTRTGDTKALQRMFMEY